MIFLRLLVVFACCLGVESAWKLTRADILFRQDTRSSVGAALALEPDAWRYAIRLSQLDETHASALLERVLALDPYSAQANIELGLQAEADGDDTRAERYLQSAFAVDRTFLPRWSLANFYLRHDRPSDFWRWARRAMEMPPQDASPLFELCWRVDPDPAKMSAFLVTDDPVVLRQYMDFLTKKEQSAALAPVASRLLRSGTAQADRAFLFSIVDRLVAANRPTDARLLWREMVDRRWMVADATLPNNARFEREPLPVSFDWSLAATAGVHSWTGSAGLETELTGAEPERCVLAEQTVTLDPGSYRLTYSYRTAGIAAGTGVRWQLVDAASGAVVAESSDLSSDAVKEEGLLFVVPSGESLFHVRLSYERVLGTARIAGNLRMLSTGIQLRT
jgi:hypothetical protein